MYSPSKRYRNAGVPTSIPYRGQKRWHTVFGLIFGLGAATWAFSGMLSMDPFPSPSGGAAGARRGPGGDAIPQALRGRVEMRRIRGEASARSAGSSSSALQVKELEFTSFAGEPIYLATLAGGDTRIIPVGRQSSTVDRSAADHRRRDEGGAVADGLAEIRVLDQYDAYYLDRRRQRPLPVILARLNDATDTRYYINPKTGRVVGTYSSRNWVNRWLYHGLHSLDFPVALQLPPAVGHRRDHVHARRHGALRDVADPGVEGDRTDARRRDSRRCRRSFRAQRRFGDRRRLVPGSSRPARTRRIITMFMLCYIPACLGCPRGA